MQDNKKNQGNDKSAGRHQGNGERAQGKIRREKSEAANQARSKMCRLQERVILRELAETGVDVDTVWEVISGKIPQDIGKPKTILSSTVEILFSHLDDPYYPMIRESIVRALTGKYGKHGFDKMLKEFWRLNNPEVMRAEVAKAFAMLKKSNVHESDEDRLRMARSNMNGYIVALLNFIGYAAKRDDLDRVSEIVANAHLNEENRGFIAREMRTKLKRMKIKDDKYWDLIVSVLGKEK